MFVHVINILCLLGGIKTTVVFKRLYQKNFCMIIISFLLYMGTLTVDRIRRGPSFSPAAAPPRFFSSQEKQETAAAYTYW